MEFIRHSNHSTHVTFVDRGKIAKPEDFCKVFFYELHSGKKYPGTVEYERQRRELRQGK